MSDARTEKPTPRRLRQARREGHGFAKSPEVAVAASLLSLFIALRLLGPAAAGRAAVDTRRFIAAAAGPDPLAWAGAHAAPLLLGLLSPFLVVAVLGALTAGVAQAGVVFTPAAARPRLANLSPRRGLERLKPSRALWDLARSAVKLALLVAAAWGPVTSWAAHLEAGGTLGDALGTLGERAGLLIGRAALAALVVAAADYAVNRYRARKALRMTRAEVKRDLKDTEGDPLVRMRRRRLASAISRNRMIMEVGLADVVVTNPTHIAVALRYDPSEPAPRVVARGAGKVAERIKAQARRHGVLVTEDRPLARALFRRCRVGHFVPATLFQAVAVVLAAAYRRRGRVA